MRICILWSFTRISISTNVPVSNTNQETHFAALHPYQYINTSTRTHFRPTTTTYGPLPVSIYQRAYPNPIQTKYIWWFSIRTHTSTWVPVPITNQQLHLKVLLPVSVHQHVYPYLIEINNYSSQFSTCTQHQREYPYPLHIKTSYGPFPVSIYINIRTRIHI